ncbi:hypothetical protein Tco_1092173 [Tanacetum coccineum]|uniref:Uncharacterized protein n=1 Tax=Tanacetum coccineum TaxID=301880 RepID=A0ABQ5I9D4_9ASTR
MKQPTTLSKAWRGLVSRAKDIENQIVDSRSRDYSHYTSSFDVSATSTASAFLMRLETGSFTGAQEYMESARCICDWVCYEYRGRMFSRRTLLFFYVLFPVYDQIRIHEALKLVDDCLWRELYLVMSDLEDSTVTYTKVSSPFKDLLDIGSSRVDGLPMMPKDPNAYVEAAFQAPLSPDYVPGPEQPPLPDFVSEPVYPEFMPPEDKAFPVEELPLPAAISPTVNSPGYIADSDPEEDPEKDPADYPAGGGDDDDDEDESSDDDEDDDDDVEEDEDEEE